MHTDKVCRTDNSQMIFEHRMSANAHLEPRLIERVIAAS